jgi:hypothetical protein
MVKANLALSAAANTQAAQNAPPQKGGLRTAKFSHASEARTPLQRITTGADR